MTKNQKADMYANIEQHGTNLNTIFKTSLQPVTLCKALLRLERKAHKLTTDYCNGDNGVNSYEQLESLSAPILKKVRTLLNNESVPIVINGDARGYALKIPDSYMRENNIRLYTDWGGNGILAPDFTPNN